MNQLNSTPQAQNPAQLLHAPLKHPQNVNFRYRLSFVNVTYSTSPASQIYQQEFRLQASRFPGNRSNLATQCLCRQRRNRKIHDFWICFWSCLSDCSMVFVKQSFCSLAPIAINSILLVMIFLEMWIHGSFQDPRYKQSIMAMRGFLSLILRKYRRTNSSRVSSGIGVGHCGCSSAQKNLIQRITLQSDMIKVL